MSKTSLRKARNKALLMFVLWKGRGIGYNVNTLKIILGLKTKSTVHRYLNELMSEGFCSKRSDKKYMGGENLDNQMSYHQNIMLKEWLEEGENEANKISLEVYFQTDFFHNLLMEK